MSDLQLQPGDRVLIPGGTGFIGKRLVKELAGKNIKLRLPARNPSKAEHILPEGKDIEVLPCDLMEQKSHEEAAKQHSLKGRAVPALRDSNVR